MSRTIRSQWCSYLKAIIRGVLADQFALSEQVLADRHFPRAFSYQTNAGPCHRVGSGQKKYDDRRDTEYPASLQLCFEDSVSIISQCLAFASLSHSSWRISSSPFEQSDFSRSTIIFAMVCLFSPIRLFRSWISLWTLFIFSACPKSVGCALQGAERSNCNYKNAEQYE